MIVTVRLSLSEALTSRDTQRGRHYLMHKAHEVTMRSHQWLTYIWDEDAPGLMVPEPGRTYLVTGELSTSIYEGACQITVFVSHCEVEELSGGVGQR